MKGHTHMASGIVLALIILLFGNINKELIIGLSFFLFAVVFADIDEFHSFIGRRFRIVSLIFDHRGFFHSIFGLVLFSALVWSILGWYYALFFAAGYFLHLFQDAFTKAGIRPFIYGLRINGSLRVGSFLENMHFAFLLVLIIGLIIKIFFF